jgi:phosphoribosylglycinamide formyltransferase-1
MKRVLVFASGTATGGGSGAANLVKKSRERDLGFLVVGFVTHHRDGGVAQHARALGVPLYCIPTPVLMVHYFNLMKTTQADLAALSGWLKPVVGLPSEKVINIHPGPFPLTSGLYGHHVHKRMIRERDERGINHTRITMHFVPPFVARPDGTNNYDTGPVFASVPVEIHPDDTAETLAARVNAIEHRIQPIYTSLVANGSIALISGRVHLQHDAWRHGIDLPEG